MNKNQLKKDLKEKLQAECLCMRGNHIWFKETKIQGSKEKFGHLNEVERMHVKKQQSGRKK